MKNKMKKKFFSQSVMYGRRIFNLTRREVKGLYSKEVYEKAKWRTASFDFYHDGLERS